MTHTALSLLESPESLIHILCWRAIHQPDAPAYTFLHDGESEQAQLTYRELDRQARIIAADLQQTVARGERALLLYPPGLDYIAAFFGCLYAGVIAVPAYPPQRKQRSRTSARLRSIAQAAQPAIALTSSAILARVGSERMITATGLPIPLVATDELSPTLAGSWRDEQAVRAETLAFLQYTSGSTATPKGVMVSHGNLLHNQRLIQQGFGHSEQTIVVGWLPLYHDMGLIGNVLQPLYLGVPALLMSPLAFLQQPVRWLQAISRYGATTSGGPNFAYDLCVEKITAEQRAELNLSSWQVAFNGSEPIRPATLERFAATFAECGFRREALYPCYGLAEATLIVAGGRAGSGPTLGSFDAAPLRHKQVVAAQATDPQSTTLVSSGHSLLDQRIMIVDPETRQRCNADQIGEIWVSGSSIAQGYWNCEEATRDTFQAQLADGSGPFLRTGDAGFMQADELFIAGRLKDLIIVRGQNYYPQDIEQTVERSHPALRQDACAAFGIDVEGEEQLVVAIEVERQQRDVDIDAVANAIRLAVAEQHELAVHGVVLLRVGTIPKTSSGKIQRRACQTGFLDGTLTVIGQSILDRAAETASAAQISRQAIAGAPVDEQHQLVTRYLQQLIAGAVGVDASAIANEQPISELGLDSLAAVQLQHRIEADLAVSIAMTALLEGQSTQQIAATILDQIASQDDRAEPSLVQVPRDRPLPLSFAQERIWFLDQLASEQAAYTIPAVVRLHGSLNTVALERGLNTIVERHEILRTTFSMEAGQPVQIVAPNRAITIEAQNLQAVAQAERETQLHQRIGDVIRQRFDLQHGPLLRAVLYQFAADEHVLLLTVHHSVADGWSLGVLMRELEQWYRVWSTPAAASDIDAQPPLPIQYADFAVWQRAWLSTARERDLSYWQQQLAGLEVLSLPLSLGCDRPATQTFRGASEWFALAPDLLESLQALSKRLGVTVFMTLLTAFQALLHRYSGQQDFAIATPVMGRQRHPLEQLIGCFVNTLVLRADLSGNPRFETAIERARQVCLQAYAHQDLPFEQLVEALQLPRDLSRNPLAQVQIVLQPASATTLQLDGLVAQPVQIDAGMSKFDLTLTLEQTDAALTGSFQYNTDLFDAATIQRMVGHFTSLLNNLTADPRQRIADVPLLTDAEAQQITGTWNATAVERAPTWIHEQIEAQAARTPEAIAVVFENDSLTYAELNRRANRLAHQLQALGVAHAQGAPVETRVGLYVERSLAMIVGVLGILKAGAAYVPLDPALPASRLAWIIGDSQTRLVVGDRAMDALAEASIEMVTLHPDGTIPGASSDTNPAVSVTGEQTAYIIYTSGSTGQPKGVMVEQRQLANYVAGMLDRLALSEPASFATVSTIAADLGNTAIFPCLCGGGSLHVIAQQRLADPRLLAEYMAKHPIDCLKIVPSHLAALLKSGQNAQVLPRKYLILGGEASRSSWIAALQQHAPSCTILNHYGPTEATVGVLTYHVAPDEMPPLPTVPLGRPLTNTQIYILNQSWQPQPIGVPGELYIGGAGVTRGYLHRPDLTAEKFVPDLFGEPGARLYRTGDLARSLPDGTIEFLGRIDDQVKVRGFRVELSEISATLLRHPAVVEAVVLLREDQTDEPQLVAYVVEHQAPSTKNQDVELDGSRTPGGHPVLGSALREFLEQRLPAHMLPSAFVVLDALPLTPNGKLDRRALPAPDPTQRALPTAFAAPETELERTIGEIWQAVLNVEHVGIHDNFFDLGGHSLLLMQVQSQMQSRLPHQLTIVDLFEHPTVSSLARYLADQSQHHQPELPDDRRQASIATGKDRLKKLLGKGTEQRRRGKEIDDDFRS